MSLIFTKKTLKGLSEISFSSHIFSGYKLFPPHEHAKLSVVKLKRIVDMKSLVKLTESDFMLEIFVIPKLSYLHSCSSDVIAFYVNAVEFIS